MEALIHGARIHYEREGSGMPILLLHAGVADHRMWDPQVKPFARHFDVIRPDMRGFGKSELLPERWSPAADVLGLVDELRLKPAHVVGCSMGGSAAIDFVLLNPERVSKLVLVGPGLGGANFGQKYPELHAEVEQAYKAGDNDAANKAEMHMWLDGPRRARGYVPQALQELFLDMNGTGFDKDWDSAPVDRLDPPAIERLHEISAPTLVVLGDEDMPEIADTVDLLMEKIPHARKAVIHDAAHLPNLEHPEEFNRLVLNFLLES